MKKHNFILLKHALIASVLLSSINITFAYEKVYITEPGPYSGINRTRPLGFSNYHPYSYYNNNRGRRVYYDPYRYPNYATTSDIKRVKRIRTLRRLQRLKNNYLSWSPFQRFNANNPNGGTLTGYSVPVTNDVYKQMGITPYDPKNNQTYKTTNQGQELYSMPSGDETYYRNGKSLRDLGGVSGRTGVTIIYD